jgi:hypothetical protein
VQRADLRAAGCPDPDDVADETVVQLADRQHCCTPPIPPRTACNPSRRRRRAVALTATNIAGLREDVTSARPSPHDSGPWSQTVPDRHGRRLTDERHGFLAAVERVFREVPRGASPFSDTSSHARAETAASWRHAIAVRSSART